MPAEDHDDEILALAQANGGEWVLFAEFLLSPKHDPERYEQFRQLGIATDRARYLARRRKMVLQTDAQVDEDRMSLWVRCADVESDGITTKR